MPKEDKYLIEYKKMQKGNKKVTYSKWKNRVKKEILQDANLDDIKKVIEIKLEIQKEAKSISIFKYVIQIGIIIAAFITMVWSYINGILQIETNDGAFKVLLDYGLKSCTGMFSACIVFMCIAALCDNYIERRRITKICYYKDLLNILKELENRNISCVYR